MCVYKMAVIRLFIPWFTSVFICWKLQLNFLLSLWMFLYNGTSTTKMKFSVCSISSVCKFLCLYVSVLEFRTYLWNCILIKVWKQLFLFADVSGVVNILQISTSMGLRNSETLHATIPCISSSLLWLFRACSIFEDTLLLPFTFLRPSSLNVNF